MASKITFDNKVSTIDSPLPEINRITGDNVNEIKQVVNANADLLENLTGLPVGIGFDFYGETAPTNYMFADGTAISRTEYSELFAVIGTTYGAGNGTTTFNLPDKRSRVSIMVDSDGAITSEFADLGETGGSTTKDISHNHKLKTNINANSGNGNGIAYTAGSVIFQNNNNTAIQTGGTTNLDILQPYIVCNYIIKVK